MQGFGVEEGYIEIGKGSIGYTRSNSVLNLKFLEVWGAGM